MDEIFPEEARQVFPYWDGSKRVYGDPLAIEDRYLADMAGEDLDELNRDLSPDLSPDPAAPAPTSGPRVLARLQAQERLADGVRAAFRLAPFDEATGEGMTADQVRTLWNRYNAWKDGLKGDTGPGASTPPPTADPAAGPGPAATSSPAAPPT